MTQDKSNPLLGVMSASILNVVILLYASALNLPLLSVGSILMLIAYYFAYRMEFHNGTPIVVFGLLPLAVRTGSSLLGNNSPGSILIGWAIGATMAIFLWRKFRLGEPIGPRAHPLSLAFLTASSAMYYPT